MTTFYESTDWSELDIFDPELVDTEVKNIAAKLQSEFWEPSVEWVAKGLDTQAGKKMFLDALTQMVRNSREGMPWYRAIDMIRRNTMEQPDASPGT